MADRKPVILHVDDDEANRYAVTRSLLKAGFDVSEAASGREALRMSAERPDLVILDVRLPDIDGFEVCRRLKADPVTALIPVLHLTASLITSHDKAEGLNGGADGYLVRPVEPVELVATVNALLRAKRSEDALRLSEERYRRLVEDIKDYAIFMVDLDGRVGSWNQGAANILGYAEAEVLGRDVAMFFTPEDRASGVPAQERRTAREEGRAADVRWHVRKSGEPFFVDGVMTAVYDDAGRPIGFSKLIRDVTERRRAEEDVRRLAAERERLAAVVRNSPDFIGIAELDGTPVFGNPAALAMAGTDEATLRRTPVIDFFDPADRATVRDVVLPAVLRDGRWAGELRLRNLTTGRVIPVMYDVFRIDDPATGEPLQLATITRDITHQKQAQEERERLLESERTARGEAERASRMKDEFLATLSHELRTPLNAILGWSQILAAGSHDAADLAEGLRTIERNARAQTQIIEDLLDMSRIISGKVRLDVQRVDLASLVHAAVETTKPAAEAKGVLVQAVLDSQTVGGVMGDPHRLQQVMWNLLSNAIKFTPRGGRVRVLLQRVESQVEISVADSGEGIDPKFLPHVFDRFRQADASTTRRHGGLGLGLAIVKQLVELHGGSIWAQSEGAGAGSAFTVSLPMSPIHRAPEPPPQGHRRHPEGGGAAPALPLDLCVRINGVRVLVVDDEPDSRAVVRRLLEDCDAVVTTAGSAAEAVERVQADPPDVLVSDIGMPGEDGYSLIRRVRALAPERGGAVPALALTAYARAEDRMRSVVAGYQMHIAKPVEPAELITMVASLAGRTAQP